jgi:hypothetical protein
MQEVHELLARNEALVKRNEECLENMQLIQENAAQNVLDARAASNQIVAAVDDASKKAVSAVRHARVEAKKDHIEAKQDMVVLRRQLGDSTYAVKSSTDILMTARESILASAAIIKKDADEGKEYVKAQTRIFSVTLEEIMDVIKLNGRSGQSFPFPNAARRSFDEFLESKDVMLCPDGECHVLEMMALYRGFCGSRNWAAFSEVEIDQPLIDHNIRWVSKFANGPKAMVTKSSYKDVNPIDHMGKAKSRWLVGMKLHDLPSYKI